MRDPDGPRGLLRAGVLDAELAGLLSILVEARTPLVVIGRDRPACERVIDGLAGLLPASARVVDVAPDDEFGWLPEATEMGWRRPSGSAPGAPDRLSSSNGVLRVRGLGSPAGVGGERARIVVRALALGYGLLATMDGDGLDDALAALHDPAVGTTDDERSRLGLVLAVGTADGAPRVTAAHHVRPVALDTHGHVQRRAPAVLATWTPGAAAWDHFAWGIVPELAARLGLRPIELEREQARRAAVLGVDPQPA